MPTPEELKAASVSMKIASPSLGNDAMWTQSFTLDDIVPTSAGLCTQQWIGNELRWAIFITAAYETGQQTVTIGDNDYTIDIPKTGLWVTVPTETLESEMIQKVESFVIDITWEHIHPIDPKFLPKGGVGYTEQHKVKADLLNDFGITVPFAVGAYRWFSDKTPTADELKAATVTLRYNEAGSGSVFHNVSVPLSFYTVVPTSSGMHASIWIYKDFLNGNDLLVGVLAAYETGQQTVVYEGQTFTVDVPQKGLYVMIPDELYETFVQLCDQFEVDAEWETVNKIEPKYLPGVCLPVVELETAVPPSGEMAGLTAKESALIDGCGGMPFIARFTIEGSVTATTPMLYVDDGEIKSYTTRVMGTDIVIVKMDGMDIWTVAMATE